MRLRRHFLCETSNVLHELSLEHHIAELVSEDNEDDRLVLSGALFKGDDAFAAAGLVHLKFNNVELIKMM